MWRMYLHFAWHQGSQEANYTYNGNKQVLKQIMKNSTSSLFSLYDPQHVTPCLFNTSLRVNSKFVRQLCYVTIRVYNACILLARSTSTIRTKGTALLAQVPPRAAMEKPMKQAKKQRATDQKQKRKKRKKEKDRKSRFCPFRPVFFLSPSALNHTPSHSTI